MRHSWTPRKTLTPTWADTGGPVAEGRASERRLEVGRRGPRSAVALAGVAPGERVVIFPPGALRDGMRVSEAA